MRKYIPLAATAAVCGSLLTLAGPAIASHSWGSAHWGKTAPVLKLTVLRAINTSKWGTAVATAINDWQKPVGTSAADVLELTAGTISANPNQCAPVKGKLLVCSAAYGKTGWLGIASIWTYNGHISQATTKLNDTYFDTATYNKPAWRALVACQEIGHDFGLSHQDENYSNANLGSCMDYTGSPGTNQHPNAHDYAQLALIYRHSDSISTTTSSATSAAALPSERPAGDTPAEWGRAIGATADGRPDLFVQDIAPGRQKITHVFWAVDEGPPGLLRHH